jgi:H+/Cl- antiporter ClcA
MIMTGVFTGLTGVAVSRTVKWLVEFRNGYFEHILETKSLDSFTHAFLFNVAYATILVATAACMVRSLTPLSPQAIS